MTRNQRMAVLQPIFDNEKKMGSIDVGNTPTEITCDTPRTASFTDDFNRADGAIGSGWTQFNTGFEIVSNQASATGATGVNAVTAVNSSFGNSQWAIADLVGIGTNGANEAFCMLMLRGTDSNNFYAAGLSNVAGTHRRKIIKRVGGVTSTLAQTGSGAVSPGVYMFSAVNSVLRLCEWNGYDFDPLLSITDTEFASGTPGMFGVRNLGAADIDDFEAGDW